MRHVVLEEAPRRPHEAMRRDPRGRDDEDVVIPLSARMPDALADLCRSFRDFLSDATDEADLRDVAYSAGAAGTSGAPAGDRRRRARRGPRRPRRLPAGRAACLRRDGPAAPGAPAAPCSSSRRGRHPAGRGARALRSRAGLPPAIERCDWSCCGAVSPSPFAVRFAIQVRSPPCGSRGGSCRARPSARASVRSRPQAVSGGLSPEDATKTIVRRRATPAGLRDDLARLAAAGHDVFIEVGTQPGLARLIRESVARDQASPLVVSLAPGRRPRPGIDAMVGRFPLCRGLRDRVVERVSPPGRFVRLPSYPWRRERYWIDDEEAAAAGRRRPRHVIPIAAADRATPTSLIDYLRDRTAGHPRPLARSGRPRSAAAGDGARLDRSPWS